MRAYSGIRPPGKGAEDLSGGVACGRMRKNMLAALLGLLTLAACSAPEPQPEQVRPVSGIPSPDAGQTRELLDALRRIDPGLDHERSISRARDTCQALLSGQDRGKVVAAARARFDGGSASVSVADARKIVKLVESSGWCR